ncbi:MAG: YggS family pyridoxal phosphate-dependent enzyme [Oscillospiraceae bacterium]|nr:YggS family pyridoxal phosphate-dependent enzyme [Oscillospiraceae bacterium]
MENLLDNSHSTFEDIRGNYVKIRGNIERAMTDAGRTDSVRLMAVTKTVSPDRINYAVELGVDLLGENRVQEYLDKRESYSPAEVHFIGALQTNKVKYIIDKVSMIHSVDSRHLAEEINRRAAQHGIVMDILAEVNIGEEETKSGISAAEVLDFCGGLAELSNIKLRGLMAIPPPGCSEDCFAHMQKLFESVKTLSQYKDKGQIDTLSMGMSSDYETAVKYGATIIRIGSGLFGYRRSKNPI